MFYQEAPEITETILEQEDKLRELETYVDSSNNDYATTRDLVNAHLWDVFRNALNSPEELERVDGIMSKVSRHPDASLRLLLMKKLPILAFQCWDRLDYVSNRLWPLLRSCITDKHDEVRETSLISLLLLIRGKLLDQDTLKRQVCPHIVEVSKVDCYASTVALMWKMAPLIGKEATEKHFLDRFIHMCSNVKVVIREMCAKSLGDMCAVLGPETTEKYLLPIFVQLCWDEEWEVRLSCAEVSVSVSCSCSLAARKTVLAGAFTDLLMDAEPYVRVTAFGCLGAFICTFADPSVAKLDYDENGELIFLGQDGFKFRMPTTKYSLSNFQSTPTRDLESMDNVQNKRYLLPGEPRVVGQTRYISNALRFIVENFNFQGIYPNQKLFKIMEQPLSEALWTSDENTCSQNVDKTENEEVDDSFNTFRFWRTPLPELSSLELEPEQDEIRANLNILDNELSSLSEKLAECSTADLEDMKTESVISFASSPDSGWNSAETTPHVESTPIPGSKMAEALPRVTAEKSSAAACEVNLPNQDIVPQLLLDYFVSMAVPLETGLMDKEIAQDCAYCLPAVALTLGPSNWPYIKNAFKCLSMNIKWRVRRTVVSSIHELASILGEEIASKDLAAIFEGFIRDLDEVKIGALEHLADFLEQVNAETRDAFLPRLKEFLETDLDWNWRYREEFGEQLILLINLYKPADWLRHFGPLATLLLCDKVAAVRHKGVLLFVDLIDHLSREPKLQEKLLYILLKKFAEDSSWRRRQVFVLVCEQIAIRRALDSENFCMVLLDHLLLLTKDPVPNVGLCVARCFSSYVVSSGYISPSSPHYSTITGALEQLKNHQDPDIKYFASLHEEERNNGKPQNRFSRPSQPRSGSLDFKSVSHLTDNAESDFVRHVDHAEESLGEHAAEGN